jgi:hypothetical protein
MASRMELGYLLIRIRNPERGSGMKAGGLNG